QLKLPIKNIQAIPIPLLEATEMQKLSEILSIIFNQISANVIEAKRLSEIRDTLLPKLMSGEIDVSSVQL
ncbi:MAG: restriction endonuclease subunit S, partial [Lachnospiraceae bacterium]|nr:restriction endonuclease subunit S [Lachnospiraceae bacterium]